MSKVIRLFTNVTAQCTYSLVIASLTVIINIINLIAVINNNRN